MFISFLSFLFDNPFDFSLIRLLHEDVICIPILGKEIILGNRNSGFGRINLLYTEKSILLSMTG